MIFPAVKLRGQACIYIIGKKKKSLILVGPRSVNPSPRGILQNQQENQQQDQDKYQDGNAAATPPILTLPHDMLQFAHAHLQRPAHPVDRVVNHIQQLPLLLQLPPHIVRLASQVAYCLKHLVQVLVLLAHHLHLLLLLKLGVRVAVAVAVADSKGVRVGEVFSGGGLVVDLLVQLLAHVFDFAAHL